MNDISYFYTDGRLNFFKTNDNKKFVVDYLMDDLEEMLDPKDYFRISRSFFVSVDCIDKDRRLLWQQVDPAINPHRG